MANWIRRDKRMAIYRRDNYSCVYCNSTDNLSLDHIIPRIKGGSNSERNLITACVSCNSERQDRDFDTFVKMHSNSISIRNRVATCVSKRIK